MIETRGLRKSFRSRAGREKKTVDAVRGVDLQVAEGEIFGFLGPNGAGKTTTLRMLATLIEPDGGEATIAGADLRTDPGEVRRRIGYVAQGGSTWDESTAREELVLQARMYGISKAEAQRRADRALDAFQLTEYADRKCKTYSGGQRRRVDIALGIIHEPKVVFLDEPTTGLDPQSRAHMWDEIRRLRAEGMTVFLTTHYLDEADALCDRIAIMDHGEIVAEGTPAELKREISGDVVTRRPRPAPTPQARPSCSTASRTSTSWRPPTRAACASTSTTAPPPSRRSCARSTRAGIALQLDRAAPAQPRRRLPDQDRPLAARVLTDLGDDSMKLARDTWLIFQRQILLLLRNPVWVFVGIFQPVMYLLLFAPLLKPALAAAPPHADAYRIFVPGLLVLLAIFGGLFQGFGLIAELRAGVIERSRVTPISRLALLLGRSLRDVVSLLAQAVIITLLALPFGLRCLHRRPAAGVPAAGPDRADDLGALVRRRAQGARARTRSPR